MNARLGRLYKIANLFLKILEATINIKMRGASNQLPRQAAVPYRKDFGDRDNGSSRGYGKLTHSAQSGCLVALCLSLRQILILSCL
jgi:hypothetical protein